MSNCLVCNGSMAICIEEVDYKYRKNGNETLVYYCPQCEKFYDQFGAIIETTSVLSDDVKEIWKKIKQARKWAEKHFNAAAAKDTFIFAGPAFFVEYPEVDRMLVTRSVLGKKTPFSFEFRLWFNTDGTTEWRGTHPYLSNKISLVLKVENTDETTE